MRDWQRRRTVRTARLGRRILQGESGNALVEFALSATILFTAIFGIMDVALALYTDHYVSEMAREATRYAMVRGSSWKNATCTSTATYSCTATAANVTSFVNSITPPGLSGTNLSVSTTWPGTTPSGASCTTTSVTNAPDCVVTVKVSYAFQFTLPFIPKDAMTLSSTSSVAIVQ